MIIYNHVSDIHKSRPLESFGTAKEEIEIKQVRKNYDEKIRWKKIRVVKDRYDAYKNKKHHKTLPISKSDVDNTNVTTEDNTRSLASESPLK